MKITLSGKAGSGKSTIAKRLAKELNLKHYSIGDLMRQLASERGISLLELSKLAETDESIDKELDDKQIALQDQDDFVIDGRLTAFFVKNADVKIFLDCDDKVRAQRILGDKRDGEESATVEETIEKIKQREDSERKRYKQYYDVDYYDESLYDTVIDTTEMDVDQVMEKVLSAIPKKT